ncbi:hypothetical protein BGX26_009478, partial [Mortierella sp. AD094]
MAGMVSLANTPNNDNSKPVNNNTNQRIRRMYNKPPLIPVTKHKATPTITVANPLNKIFNRAVEGEGGGGAQLNAHRRSTAAIPKGLAADYRRRLGALDHWGRISHSLPLIPAYNSVTTDTRTDVQGGGAGYRSG